MNTGIYLQLTDEQLADIIELELSERIRDIEEEDGEFANKKTLKALQRVRALYQSFGEEIEYEDDICESLFKVVFRDCNGDITSTTLIGDSAGNLIDILRAFASTYEKSGFVNKLSITAHNRYMGDTLITAHGDINL